MAILRMVLVLNSPTKLWMIISWLIHIFYKSTTQRFLVTTPRRMEPLTIGALITRVRSLDTTAYITLVTTMHPMQNGRSQVVATVQGSLELNQAHQRWPCPALPLSLHQAKISKSLKPSRQLSVPTSVFLKKISIRSSRLRTKKTRSPGEKGLS